MCVRIYICYGNVFVMVWESITQNQRPVILRTWNTVLYLSSDILWLSQVPWERAASVQYLPGPATHTTGAGRVLDGVRDTIQRNAPLAISCTGLGLVPVLPARCHRCAGASWCFHSLHSVANVQINLKEINRWEFTWGKHRLNKKETRLN